MNKINFLNISIDNIRCEDLLQQLTEKGGFVVTPNVDHLVKLQTDSLFLKAYNIADYVVCDSKILQYILKLCGTPIKEKISGSDLLPAFYRYNRDNEKIKIFLLGGKEGVAKQAQININDKMGREMVVDALSPSFGFEKDERECEEIIQKINESSANVLAIGVGAPKQEMWVVKYRSRLPNISIFLPIGATIDFEAGYKPRSPQWMSNIGLEWLYRLVSEPQRLWKRYLVESLPFFLHTIKYRFDIYQHNPILELKSLPLGKMLCRAGLLSEEELKLILAHQKEKNYQVKLGKIIEELGLLSSETITFFAEELPEIIDLKQVFSMEYYLQKAKLISLDNLDKLKQEKLNNSLNKSMTELIIEGGYLSAKTIDWLIELQYVLKSQQGIKANFKYIYNEFEQI